MTAQVWLQFCSNGVLALLVICQVIYTLCKIVSMYQYEYLTTLQITIMVVLHGIYACVILVSQSCLLWIVSKLSVIRRGWVACLTLPAICSTLWIPPTFQGWQWLNLLYAGNSACYLLIVYLVKKRRSRARHETIQQEASRQETVPQAAALPPDVVASILRSTVHHTQAACLAA